MEADDQITQKLTEKQQIFAALYEYVTAQETPHKRLLLRGDTTDLQQGEVLLNGAINEGKTRRNVNYDFLFLQVGWNCYLVVLKL